MSVHVHQHYCSHCRRTGPGKVINDEVFCAVCGRADDRDPMIDVGLGILIATVIVVVVTIFAKGWTG